MVIANYNVSQLKCFGYSSYMVFCVMIPLACDNVFQLELINSNC